MADDDVERGQPILPVVVDTYGPDQALALAGAVHELFQAVFSEPPFNAGEVEFANHRSYFPTVAARPGFRLTLARSDSDYVAFGYGYVLSTDTHWWTGLGEPVGEEFAVETGTRTFVIIDYGVLPAWRGAGVGRAVHDVLLGGSGAERASLSVRPTATETKAIYQGWGWRKVSYKVMDPPIPTPVFDILVLEQLPSFHVVS
jgi:ribosomal protein S18 acetylase RimI-like enzyme